MRHDPLLWQCKGELGGSGENHHRLRVAAIYPRRTVGVNRLR
jgi:hypothetical protein